MPKPKRTSTCPLPAARVVDVYFLEHRAKLIDIAAFLDRIDRAGKPREGRDDFRIAAFRKAIGLLLDGRTERARRVLESLSDPTRPPIPAAGTKGASGAYAGDRKCRKPRKQETTK
jgi:hypothetical protein